MATRCNYGPTCQIPARPLFPIISGEAPPPPLLSSEVSSPPMVRASPKTLLCRSPPPTTAGASPHCIHHHRKRGHHRQPILVIAHGPATAKWGHHGPLSHLVPPPHHWQHRCGRVSAMANATVELWSCGSCHAGEEPAQPVVTPGRTAI
jgi:hypothetical protein